ADRARHDQRAARGDAAAASRGPPLSRLHLRARRRSRRRGARAARRARPAHLHASLSEVPMRPMRPDDILKIRFVSDPRISPDGRRVAFVLAALSQEGGEYLSNIWMVATTRGAP